MRRATRCLLLLVAAAATGCGDPTGPNDTGGDGTLVLQMTWGTPGDGPGELDLPVDVAVSPRNHVFVLDAARGAVLVFEPDGTFRHEWPLATGAPETPPFASEIAIDPAGRVWVLEAEGVRQYTLDGLRVRTIPRARDPEAGFTQPTDLAAAANGDLYVVSETFVYRYDATGNLLERWGGPGDGPGRFSHAAAVTVRADGRIAVADRNQQRMELFERDGRRAGGWPLRADKHTPWDLAADPHDHVYVLLIRSRVIDRFRGDGSFDLRLGDGGPGTADLQLGTVQGLGTSPAGLLYAADAANARILRFGPPSP